MSAVHAKCDRCCLQSQTGFASHILGPIYHFIRNPNILAQGRLQNRPRVACKTVPVSQAQSVRFCMHSRHDVACLLPAPGACHSVLHHSLIYLLVICRLDACIEQALRCILHRHGMKPWRWFSSRWVSADHLLLGGFARETVSSLVLPSVS